MKKLALIATARKSDPISLMGAIVREDDHANIPFLATVILLDYSEAAEAAIFRQTLKNVQTIVTNVIQADEEGGACLRGVTYCMS